MRFRRLILSACIAVIVYLAALTGWVAASSGPDVLTALSLLILGLLGFGVVGALREARDARDAEPSDPDDPMIPGG